MIYVIFYLYIQDHRAEDLLYQECAVTAEESQLLIISFTIRYGLTDVALEDLLKLINIHLPQSVLPSRYLFLKKFPPVSDLKFYYFCPECIHTLKVSEAGRRIRCSICKNYYYESNLKRNGHYFTYIPLRLQLQNIFECESLFEKLVRDPESHNIGDVISGEAYRRLRQHGIIGDYDISIQWNADGVQTFKSSRISMCPIQVMINELPYRLRKDNILLVGLWASQAKPSVDLFFEPFIDELTHLHKNGFQCKPPGFDQPITIKVHTLLSSVDSVQKPCLQNIRQFNGEYGCYACLSPGKQISIGRGTTRVYCGDLGEPRTREKFKIDAITASRTQKIINGIKGVSPFLKLPLFNIVLSFPPDYLHCVLLGVVKLFETGWFDSKNHDKPWYLGLKKDLFDKRMEKILPPSEISRTPRLLKDLKNFKGSEFRNFLLHYSLAVLKDLLPNAYYKHWSLLVYAITKFNSNEITEAEFRSATDALREFVFQVEDLYGEEFMKYNVHLLLHLPEAVKYFGALWAWSTFPYEDYNHTLRNMLFNSQCIVQQICKSYLRLQSIKSYKTFKRNNCNKVAQTLFRNLTEGYKYHKTGTMQENRLITLGKKNIKELSLVQKLSAERIIAPEKIYPLVESYERFIFKNILIHGQNYERLKKRKNSTIITVRDKFLDVQELIKVITLNGGEIWVIMGKEYVITNDTIYPQPEVPMLKYNCIAYKETNIVRALFPNEIRKKCVNMPDFTTDDKCFISPLVNCLETD